MSNTCKQTLIIILKCYFLLTIAQTIVAKHSIEKNKTNNSQTSQAPEKQLLSQTILDYNFFSYDVIDHRTLMIKFNLTETILFQHSQILYDAHLYVSKIPATNYKIIIGPFSGFYEMKIDGTIIDHFTFCLVLIPNLPQTKYNITSNRNKTKTIFHHYLKSSHKNQQQYIAHYCTKMGPDENRYHHQKKEGSHGDHILLLLQLMMIGIFLTILQIVHISRSRKYREWRVRQLHRIHHKHRWGRGPCSFSQDGLGLLRFIPIHEEKEELSEQEGENKQKEEEGKEEEENPLISSHRRLLSPTKPRIRTRSPTPTFDFSHGHTNESSIEHILGSKPWLERAKSRDQGTFPTIFLDHKKEINNIE